ncbi:MAG: DUF2341 domain-containing protein [Bacteroidales bacterium]|jgi:gliding motility-associated-like protein|nr:DUF2341 domain-containing protein [Bacteroidales bacterium]
MKIVKFIHKIFVVVFLIVIVNFTVKSSSCLPGWKYQREIDVTNGGITALTDFQVLLEFNSANFVSAGKMNISGSDIRFMDDNNNLLSYWIVPGTFNTTNTQVWINVTDIPLGPSVIYMYYGNNTAYNASRGEETFEFFDDFERGTGNWNFCGGSYYIDNGELELYSTASDDNQAVMQTVQAFSAPFVSEMNVTNYSGDNSKKISITQLKSNTEGYGFTYFYSAGDKMEISKYTSGTDCFDYSTSFGTAILSTSIIGKWEFAWKTNNTQNGKHGNVDLQGNDTSIVYPTTLYSGAAVYGTVASVTIDWYRIRKWANSDPVLTLNTSLETLLPDAGNINEGSNSPLCEGQTLTLFADDIGSATYTWKDPTALSFSNAVTPVPIDGVTGAQAGTYQLIVEPTSGSCTSITLEIEVEISDNTVVGIIDGDTVVCSGNNGGVLELKSYIGDIVRWEYSLTGGDPWATIENTSSQQNYQDLTQTTYYRAVVKNGECNQLTSDVASITVNSLSNAGTATGDAVICKNESANISLNSYNGDIIWEKKPVDETLWSAAGFSSDNFNTVILDTTTYYRAIVTNSICDPDTSNTLEIIVNCASVGGTVELDTVCTGDTGELVLIAYTGTILRWEESSTGGNPWATVQESGSTLAYENVEQTKYYRVVIQNSGCDIAYSTIGGVIVDQNPTADEILGINTVCYQNNTGEIVLSDYTGTINNWEYSVDNESSWYNIVSTNDTINYTNLLETTFFRVGLSSEYNKCPAIYSNSVKLTVNETTLGGTTGYAATVCSSANNGTIKLSAQRGDVLRWEKSNTGNTPWDVIANTTDSLKYINLQENTFYRAVVQNGACVVEYSDSTLITVNQTSNAGIITGSTSHCAENNQGLLVLTNYIGSVTKWEKSTDNITWNFKSYVTPNTIEYSDIADSTFYRVLVQSGVCPADTSDISGINIYPLPTVDFETDTVELGEATHFTNLSTISYGSLTEYQWDFDNGSSSIAKNPIETFIEAKTYFVSLKVKSDKGCLDSTKKAVLVNPTPVVDFSFNNVCLGDTMFFVNHSTISLGTVTYEWNFDDSNTSDLTDPYNIYATDGTFQVTLIATTDKGVQSSTTKTVNVYPRANLGFIIQDVCEMETISFINQSVISNGSLNFYWDFGDGESSTSINPNHEYNTYGSYNISLISTTNYNCKDTLIKPVNIYPLPLADFQVDDVPFQTIADFADISSISSGTIDTWNWSFGDGNFSDVQNPEYLYSSPGSYLVNLTVSSDFGCTQSVSKNINISPIPNASFTAENVCLGNAMSFINQTTILSGGLSYEWDFGDSENSVDENPTHSYVECGNYTVTLIVTSDLSGKDTIQKGVEVYPNPEPDFTVPDVCDGSPSYFTNVSTITTGSINTCAWDFGDGTNSIQHSPVKQYLNADAYNVELRTISDKGCESTITKEAFVRENPLANFTVSNECLGVSVNISNHSNCEEGNVYYYWDLGDGSSSLLENPDHNYTGSGVYNIKLVTGSSYQCVDSLSRYVTIFSLPQVDAGADTNVSRGFTITLQASGANIFDWSPSESLDNPGVFNPVARPMETTSYSVRGIDVNACENTDNVTVTVSDDYQLIASNILTPDYNGLNDTWKITNIDAFETATVYIFNRWGEEVFSQQGYMNDWDGRNSNGDILPDGTYYYIIKFPDSSKHYSGSITILRNQ